MRLSTSMNMIKVSDQDDRLPEVMKTLRDCGFALQDWDAVDFAWPGMKPGSTQLTGDNWRDWIGKIALQAERLQITLNQAHCIMYNYFEPKEYWLQEMDHRVLECCGMLKIPVIVYHPVTPSGLKYDNDTCLKMNAPFLQEIAGHAQKLHIKIAVENMFHTMAPGVEIWRYCSEPEELVRLVEAIGMPNVGICMDIGHANLMHADWDEYLSIYGKHLITLHVADNDRTSDQHYVPGHGSVDWEKLMLALKRHGYAGDFTLETHNSIRYLPECAARDMIRTAYVIAQHWVDFFNSLQ